ncbi:MAG: HDOD domain-containing protein [candidate division Zixibacteria bacterium]|nr:HDOD domain-containing protein [candidate division Zixibacteria bacterium]
MVQGVKSNSTLEKILSTVDELPASPAIVNSVMGLTSDLDSTIEEVSRVLSSDQSLTAKVLRLSNSPYYGRTQEVTNLEEAVLLLGFSTVRSMVVATSARGLFNMENKDGWEAKLYRHSISTAIASRQIAGHIKHPAKDQIFIAALLHDIGKLVLMQKIASRYREVVEQVESRSASFFDTENGILGFTHCDVASILLKKWLFPSSLIEAINEHHCPPAPENGKPAPLAHVINVGNYMAKKLEAGFNDCKIENLEELESAKILELDDEALEEIYEKFKEYYQIEIKILE